MQELQTVQEIVQQLNIIDDTLFQKMAEDPEFCEEMISTILQQQVTVKKVTPQNSIKNLQGRSVVLDALCNLENGEASFPFLGANIVYKSTQKNPDWIEPYTVVEKGNVKVNYNIWGDEENPTGKLPEKTPEETTGEEPEEPTEPTEPKEPGQDKEDVNPPITGNNNEGDGSVEDEDITPSEEPTHLPNVTNIFNVGQHFTKYDDANKNCLDVCICGFGVCISICV